MCLSAPLSFHQRGICPLALLLVGILYWNSAAKRLLYLVSALGGWIKGMLVKSDRERNMAKEKQQGDWLSLGWSSQYWHILVLNISNYICHCHCHLIRSLWNWQVVKFIVVVTGFQNSEFCLKASILALEINTVSYFPWSDKLTLFFSRKWLNNRS